LLRRGGCRSDSKGSGVGNCLNAPSAFGALPSQEGIRLIIFRLCAAAQQHGWLPNKKHGSEAKPRSKCVLLVSGQAIRSLTTFPFTSVKRKSRPLWRKERRL